MAGTFKVSGYACSAHDYPVDARNAFGVSVERTLENLVEELEIVANPLNRTAIQAGEFSGMISVKADALEIDLTVIPGFCSAKMRGDADYVSEAGAGCSGGAVAIGKAVEEAMKEALERLGERLSNAPRLR